MKVKLYYCGLPHHSNSMFSENSLGLGYLKTNCKNADIEIVLKKEELKDCDLIGLSCYMPSFKEAIDILNSTNIPVVIGGPITQWEGLKDYDFKHIVKGEGEIALQSIVDGKETEKIISKPLIKDLDTLNFPERGNCDVVVPILTSRGCVFKCKFCGTPNFWKRYRCHSPEYFISEVEYVIKKYPHSEYLKISDNLFVLSEERFFKIYDLWMKKNLHKKIGLIGSFRSDLFNKRIGVAMKKMGFKVLNFGAESGSNRVLELVDKKTTVENNQKAIDICYEIGLPLTMSFIKDIPGSSWEDEKETLKFMFKNSKKMSDIRVGSSHYSFVAHYQYAPYPGIELFDKKDLLEYWKIKE